MPVHSPRGRFYLLAVGCLLLVLSACNRPTRLPMMQAIAGQTMGTTYSIKLIPGTGQADLTQISQAIETELERVNAQMSTYLTTSELSRFNQQASDAWFDVSPETAEVVSLALELFQQTEGAFDVTVGPLVNLWGFGPSPRPAQIPPPAAIAEALQSVGADKLQVRLTPPALRKTHPKLQVDLSAIAKGHGVDRVAQQLDRLGVQSYFVEIGGEVRVKGAKLDGQLWQVGIERPQVAERSVQRALGLKDQSLATSGNYRNFFEMEGRRFSHTINPRTGLPVEESIASASVVADTCAVADGIATGMMAAGYEAGLRLAEEHGWAVFFVRVDATGTLESSSSSAFRDLFPEPDKAR